MAPQLRVLGPLEILDGETPISLRGERPRSLLLALYLLPGEWHSADQLIDAVWGEEPPPTAQTALHVHISTLRRVLGRDAVESGPGGYRLVIDDVDAERFERRLEAGRSALRTGDAERASRLLIEGLAMWRGPAFADVADAGFAQAEAMRLDDLRLDAREDLFDAQALLGHHEEVAAEVQEFLAEQPYRERAWTQLITALYRAGRQASALEAYGAARRRLRDDLGIDPGPELQDLQQRVLRQDPALLAASAAVADGHHPPPVALTPLIGRSSELASIREWLMDGESRLVTLTGPGGIGKTRLALELAGVLDPELSGGATFVALAAVDDANAVIPAIASAVGASLEPGGSTLDALVARCTEPMLLVLDNLEQLVDAGPSIAELLSRTPRLRILATSRTPLQVRGEREVRLPPLAEDQAVELFIDRARDAGAAADASDAVRELCRRLDHLPLALEIVAARATLMGPEGLLERISESLDFRAARDADARQSTLRTAIGWSHDLLPSSERQLFARLAVFRAGCTFDAAERVCDADADGLLALLRQSLLGRREAPSGTRYQMLDTVHRYARELLDAAPDREVISERHFEYMSELGRQSAAAGDTDPAWLDRLDDERADIHAALRWALSTERAADAVALYESVRDHARARGRAADERTLIDAILAAPGVDDHDRVDLLHEGAVLAARQGDIEGCDRYALAALEIARAMPDARRETMALQMLAMMAGERADDAAESAYIDQMLEASRASGEPRAEIVALAHVALRALRREDYDEAAGRYGEIVDRMRAVGVMRESLAAAFLNRGLAELHAGRSTDAARSLAEAAQIARELRDFDTLGYVLEGYAALAVRNEDHETAALLQGAASASLATAGTALEAFEAGMRDRTTAAVRSALGSGRYSAQFEAGTTLAVDDALRSGATVAGDTKSGGLDARRLG